MKVIIILVVCVAFAISTCAQNYDTKYDSIDIDAILSNERVLGNYIKCLLEGKPCTKEGRLLKHDLPDAIQTNCEKCSDAQKSVVRKASKHMMDRRPEDWQKLQHKFDPDGSHQEDFEKFILEE